MPLLLRKIRKNRWYKDLAWLPGGNLQADSLVDLTTKDNKLSVWFIKDDMSNLERVIAALAANRDFIANFDYALFSEEILEKKDIKTEKSKGDSKDYEANDQWHRDLYELSATKLLDIAEHIFNEGTIKRIQEKQVEKHINEAVQTGKIKFETLEEEVKSKINN